MPFKVILKRFEVVFCCLEWECCTFQKTDKNSFKSTNFIAVAPAPLWLYVNGPPPTCTPWCPHGPHSPYLWLSCMLMVLLCVKLDEEKPRMCIITCIMMHSVYGTRQCPHHGPRNYHVLPYLISQTAIPESLLSIQCDHLLKNYALFNNRLLLQRSSHFQHTLHV